MPKCVGEKPMNNERDYDALLAAGNRAQLEKLREKEHKGPFDGAFIELGSLLYIEALELLEAIRENKPTEIRREAADVANYAHMIIQAVDGAGRNE